MVVAAVLGAYEPPNSERSCWLNVAIANRHAGNQDQGAEGDIAWNVEISITEEGNSVWALQNPRKYWIQLPRVLDPAVPDGADRDLLILKA